MSFPSTSALPPDDHGDPLFTGATSAGSVPAQDLSREGLLSQLPRDGDNRPVLGGIPLSAKLGQGGMGAVYYGVHPRLHNEVAVKVLPFHLADKNPILIKRFFAEARVAARVKSPHIVNVLDVNEDEGVFYLVMEFIDGMTAAQVLRKLLAGDSVPPIDINQPGSGVSARVTPVGAGAIGEPGLAGGLPEWAALEICMGAAEGLNSAHAYDVIHRDVKPDNILVPRLPKRGAQGALDLRRAKLADLGLAKPEDSDSIGTISQLTMGTPGYMSPEQIRDAKRASKPSDVFSLGSTLYALLAGRSPFSGHSVGDLLVKTITEPHEPLHRYRPDVSQVTQELIDHALAKDPAERFADGAEILEALQMAAAGVQYPSGALRSLGDSRASSNARASRVAEMLTPPPPGPAHIATVTGIAPAPEGLPAAPAGSGGNGGAVQTPIARETPASQRPAPVTPPVHAAPDTFGLATSPGLAAQVAAAPGTGTPSDPAAPAPAAAAPNPNVGDLAQAQLSTAPVGLSTAPAPRTNPLRVSAGNAIDPTPHSPLPPVLIGASHNTPALVPQRISKQPPIVPDEANLNYSARVSRLLSRMMHAEPGQRKSAMPLILAGCLCLALAGTLIWWFAFELPHRAAAQTYQTAMTAARAAETQAFSAEDAQSEKQHWQEVISACQTALNAVPDDPDAHGTQDKATAKLDAVSQEIRRSGQTYRDALAEAQANQADAEKDAEAPAALAHWQSAVAACNRALRARAEDTAVKAMRAVAQSKVDDLEGAVKALDDARTAVADAETKAHATADFAEKVRLLTAAATRGAAALRAFPDPDLTATVTRLNKELPLLDAMAKASAALSQADRNADPAQSLALIQFAADIFGRGQNLDADPAVAAAAHVALDRYNRAFYGGFVEVRRIDPFADMPSRDNLLGCALSPNESSLALFAPGGVAQVWSMADRKRTATLPAGAGAILDACFVNDHQLATASFEKNVILWTLPGGEKKTTLLVDGSPTSHQGPVKFLELAPDGQTLLSGSDDKTVAVWDLVSAKRLCLIAGHTDFIASAVFSPDGQTVLTASHDGTARLWNARTGAPVREFKGHTGKVYRAVFDHAGDRVLTVSEDKTAKIWDAASGACLKTLVGHQGAVLWGEFAAHDDRVITSGSDNTARIWNAVFPAVPAPTPANPIGEPIYTLQGHTGLVNRARFCVDDTVALTASYDGTIRLWDLRDATPLVVLTGHEGPVLSVWLTSDGRSIYSAGGHTVRQWTNPFLPHPPPGAPTPDDAYRLALEDARHAEQSAQQLSADPYSARAAWQEAVHAYDRALRMNALDADAATRRLTALGKVQEVGAALAAREKELADCLTAARAASQSAAELTRGNDTKAGETYAQWTTAQERLRRALALKPGDADVRQELTAAVTGRIQDYFTRLSPVRTLTGHTARVEAVAFSPDGKAIASAGEDATVRLWNAATGAALFSNQGHKAWPNTLLFSPDGTLLYSADNVAIFAWDAVKGTRVGSCNEANDAGLALSVDGKSLLALAAGAASIKTRDAHSLESGAPIDLPQLAVNKLAFSADQHWAVAQLADGGLRVLQAPAFNPVQTLESTDETPVSSLAIDAQNRFALAACVDGTVRLWSLETGKRLQTFTGHHGSVSFAVFSPDGTLVLSGGADRTARLWATATGAAVNVLYGHPDTCYDGAFAPDGRAVAIASGSAVSIWCNPQDDTQPLVAPADADKLHDLSLAMAKAQRARAVALASKDFDAAERATEMALAGCASARAVHPADPAAAEELVQARQLRTAQLATLAQYDQAIVAGLGFADKARAARAAGTDPAPLCAQAVDLFTQALTCKPGDARAQNLIDQTRLSIEGNPFASVAQIGALDPLPAAITALRFLPDGRRLLVGLADGEVIIQEIETGKQRIFKDHSAAITALDISPDGAAFASASLDKTVRIVALDSGTTAHILAVNSPVRAANFSQTGKTLLTGSDDGVARLWDVASGAVYKELNGHTAAVTAAAISRDGNYVLTASEDKAIKLWDLLEGKVLRTCDGHTGAVLGALFSPDGKSVLSFSADQSARLWNVADGRLLHELSGHSDKVFAGVFFGSGKALVTGGADKTVRIWDVLTGAPLKRLDDPKGPIHALAVSPDGKTIAGGGDAKVIRLWADPADQTNPLLFKKPTP